MRAARVPMVLALLLAGCVFDVQYDLVRSATCELRAPEAIVEALRSDPALSVTDATSELAEDDPDLRLALRVARGEERATVSMRRQAPQLVLATPMPITGSDGEERPDREFLRELYGLLTAASPDLPPWEATVETHTGGEGLGPFLLVSGILWAAAIYVGLVLSKKPWMRRRVTPRE